MTAADITALAASIPAIIGAITALIIAVKSGRDTQANKAMLTAHLTTPGRHSASSPLIGGRDKYRGPDDAG
jgi:hypothetical protein